MKLCVSTTRAGIASTDSNAETYIKTSLVLKKTNADLKNVPLDILKHANISSEKGFANLEKIAVINTRVTLTKI